MAILGAVLLVLGLLLHIKIMWVIGLLLLLVGVVLLALHGVGRAGRHYW